SQMILDSDDDKQDDIIEAIAAEPKLNEEHIANMYDYLKEQDPALAEDFMNAVKESKDAETVNNAAQISKALNISLSTPIKEGLLAKLKAKLFGRTTVEDNQIVFSETEQAYKLQVNKAKLLDLAKANTDKDHTDNKNS
ncbi:hypothetical protein, partial [Cysteiniphilum litorale]|uniref:hypothetical protein n=2 Tax=Cysteiniphilum TaxID=2056696 RepID=UPI00130073CB